MNVIIIDNGSSYLGDLKNLFQKYNVKTIPYGDINTSQLDVNDLVILSGGHGLPFLWHKRVYKKERGIAKNHGGPVIGICLGFEIIASSYGNRLHLRKRRRKGNYYIYPLGEDNNIISKGEKLSVYENHRWSLGNVRLPLIPIAKSNNFIEIFKHVSKPLYGLQFHPEEKNSIDGRLIIDRILNDIWGAI